MKRGPSPNDLPPGTLIGAFEILAPLGRGGMGAVYQARNRITGDVRALKLILPELAASAEFVDRFVREIRLAMAVEHPNLVRVFEPGMDGELIFLPMELLQGEPLGARIHRDRVVTVEAAIALVQSIGSALSALHARGILHRDVKPSNVFLAQDGANVVPKLLDLGAGKEVGASDELTSTGLAIGSPHYMAPEQAAGQKNVDARIDQYALAVLTYQLLTGARPYENDDTGHVLAKVLSGAPYRTPRAIRADISPETEAAVLRGMSRNRDNRFSSIDEFVAALSPVPWNGRPLAGPPTPASVENRGLNPVCAEGARVRACPVRPGLRTGRVRRRRAPRPQLRPSAADAGAERHDEGGGRRAGVLVVQPAERARSDGARHRTAGDWRRGILQASLRLVRERHGAGRGERRAVCNPEHATRRARRDSRAAACDGRRPAGYDPACCHAAAARGRRVDAHRGAHQAGAGTRACSAPSEGAAGPIGRHRAMSRDPRCSLSVT